MGIHDREYYREETPRGINLGGTWSIVGKLIAINAAIYVVDMFTTGDRWLADLLAASPESISKPWMCWQLVTYSFSHSAVVGHIFWNMFGLFIFGRDIEQVYGRKEFLWFYLVAATLGGLAFALRYLAIWDPASGDPPTVRGASGAVMAVTLLFCLKFPKRTILLMMVLPVPAWALGTMYILGNIAGMSSSKEAIAFDVHLVGAAFAICYFKFGWRISGWVPGFRLPKIERSPKLKIHEPDDNYGALDSEADELLQKVGREGMDSLTKQEQRKLEAYSRRMKQKHR